MQPEEFLIKSYVLENGRALNGEDLRRGLNWNKFEFVPRPTRPLSSYFEIIDTKFRSWLWQYVPPHPSLSLTWIFTLGLTPLALFYFLRSLRIEPNIALSAVAYYLSTPAVMSCVFMLFRPAKAMTSCGIVLCLLWAACIHKKYLWDERQRDVPIFQYVIFLTAVFINLFWDETALILYPALFFFYPRLVLDKKRIVWFLSLPVLVGAAYFYFIPTLTVLAGWAWVDLSSYDMFRKAVFTLPLKSVMTNVWLLFSENYGLIYPSAQMPKVLCIFVYLNWAWLLFVVVRVIDNLKAAQDFKKLIWWLSAIVLSAGVHAYLVSVTNGVWGPYYYGAFTSIFFAIGLAKLLELSKMDRFVWLSGMLIVIMILWTNFFAVNKVYKALHYYPARAGDIGYIYTGEVDRYDPGEVFGFLDGKLKSAAYDYWMYRRTHGREPDSWELPKELLWMAFEINPGKYHFTGDFFIDRRYYSREDLIKACRSQ